MEQSCYEITSTPLGPVWVCATEGGICGLGFGAYPTEAEVRRMARFDIAPPESESSAMLEAAVAQLADYFERRLQVFNIPLDLRGTPFQRAVWAELLTIPYGKTLTYGEVAIEIEHPRAFRAVGQANGANPVAIIVPCHRVIGRNGWLTGYAAGVERKAALLQLEQAGLQLRF
ncbi:MAG TPA: methylated-DNA--[protein]-cysteine S-methyltransferase [Anaerolineae bacterium]|nr:methylated-DNA--[protein]-cysteine S-methyltransferase [Anaerolineae bacterium]HQH37220.1 methylated-DNA--[protein]-cysteine S-methyltransferase [Anaerolineae bacterium]